MEGQGPILQDADQPSLGDPFEHRALEQALEPPAPSRLSREEGDAFGAVEC